jgi:hypothetical protein
VTTVTDEYRLTLGKCTAIKHLMALLKHVDDWEHFGVAELSQGGRILVSRRNRISRSPAVPSQPLPASTCSTVPSLKSSTRSSRRGRGEVEISVINNVCSDVETRT